MDQRAVAGDRLGADAGLARPEVAQRQRGAVLPAFGEVAALGQRVARFRQAGAPVPRRHAPEPGEAREIRHVATVEGPPPVPLPREAQHRVRPHRQAAVDRGREVDAQERQVGIGHGIDQVAHEAALGGGHVVVLAAERHHAVVDGQAREPGDPVGLQARAGHEPARAPRRSPGLDGDAAPVLADGVHGRAEHHRAAPRAQEVAHGGAHARVVDDARGGREQGAEPRDLGLAPPQLGRVERLDRDAVRPGVGPQRRQAREFARGRGDDELAAGLERDAVLGAEGDRGRRAAPAEVRLEAAGLVVDPGVDDAAVAAGLVAGGARLLFEHEHRRPRPAPREFERGGEPQDASADDADVVGHAPRGGFRPARAVWAVARPTRRRRPPARRGEPTAPSLQPQPVSCRPDIPR